MKEENLKFCPLAKMTKKYLRPLMILNLRLL